MTRKITCLKIVYPKKKDRWSEKCLNDPEITRLIIVCPKKGGKWRAGVQAKSNQWVSLVPPDLAAALSLSERNLGQERHLVSRGDTDSLQLSMVQGPNGP